MTLLIVGYIQYALPVNDFIRIMFATILAAVVMSVLWLPDIYGDRIIPLDDLETTAETASTAQPNSFIHNIKTAEDNQLPSKTPDHEYESFSSYDQASFDDATRPKSDTNGGVSYTDCYYGESVPVIESIKTWRFWCLYFVYFIVSGTGNCYCLHHDHDILTNMPLNLQD